MLTRLIRFSIEQRWLVMIFTLAVLILGIFSFQHLPIDAVPDITNVQVQINTSAPGYSPLESEQRITFPIETLMAGIPHLKQTRSLSKYGLSQVTVVFEDGTDIYFARQQVGEKLQTAANRLPPGISPEMGPISTGLGEIFMWTVEAEPNARKEDGSAYTPMDLRTLQDWLIRPQLRSVKGVTDVNSMGGFQKQFHVTPFPEKLLANGLSLHDLVMALERNNANVGAGYIERNGEQYLIRVPGQAQTETDIGNIIVDYHAGFPIRIRQLADVSLGKELRTGAATRGGHETVLGTAVMLLGSNSREVAEAVGQKLEEVNKSLPAGVHATAVYDRTELVDKAIHTVEKNLSEGALLVVVILFLFLGNIRAALITAMIIPVAMCFTLSGMVAGKLSANLMSLGALDFGIIVDGAVVIVENSIRRLAIFQHAQNRAPEAAERREVVFEASREASKEILFGQLIIMIVYLPILTLTGVEGKMFIPMALTVVMALLGAMVLSFTFVPAAVALFVSGKVSEKENFLLQVIKRGYVPSLKLALRHRGLVVSATLLLLGFCTWLAIGLGKEFVPSLNEGDVVVQPVRIPGTSLSQSVEMQHSLDAALEKLPEVKLVFSRIGTAEIASDPMSPNEVDTFVMLKEKNQWPNPNLSKEDVIAKMEAVLKEQPGSIYEFTQPIEMRFNELIAGVRADVAVKVFGDDREILLSQGEQIAKIIEKVPGAADVKLEQIDGLPMMTVALKRNQLSRYGLNVADVQELIEIAIGGKAVGEIFEGDRRFSLVVRLPENLRNDLDRIRRLPVPIHASSQTHPSFIPLSAVAEFKLAPGPNQISREQGKRRIVITANVRGRDMGSFVEEAESQIQAKVKLPSGYWMAWGGQFQQMISAAQRLQLVVPIALFLILGLLFMSFGNLKDALLVFSGVPLALTGGVLALWIRQIPLSISAGVGFIALSGVAVLNGLVLVSFIKHLQADGKDLHTAVTEGALVRLRPVLMTALVASLGFVPMALAHGTGAEVQKPLATVVIGGILSSTLLTLVVLPVLYLIFNRPQRKEAQS
ncbi:CusA/CzcA family heavy metal efflux RND transporter [bacterium (Candidatus Blackallbacteria) CG17_big_fil_post_rev_8_21_14_2_50_48_46]|uniref:CusA/CzcA family heavy metal efflux RND transporter n=1 Tax=bacterium (Candidatus Blackallbacteria) CG17_big_fil_post_rev_8_21_14_2_50_48_46 TaxID=2014261 RepID=A0A2M7FY95_9BACT|nr:MAG: CusA/CzcA family heavy metal efflux RND transporter [bacterium (Candidatus Blackallbacteria) CG18_big_fil_WC_8_21_14_2_50_49_26]PIW14314.1 MAG: CusA/CzcA family heavy metal efflux RND transporter [bacterium (Candidatus Blackallbacteria) CG17_big_fil_post_rev_8_21_14_2_50_48_46]PIW45583.1 MAG: CusA/CzcA family heavy metal efflux RND transporter [bacterium (Candidatus Blackallbacteria) CG13_big_fil_rev_8_21_14_2_50_49_14]